MRLWGRSASRGPRLGRGDLWERRDERGISQYGKLLEMLVGKDSMAASRPSGLMKIGGLTQNPTKGRSVKRRP